MKDYFRTESLFSGAHRQDRGYGHKLKCRRVPLNIREHFLIVRVAEHQHKLPRKYVESPSVEILKICPNTVLGNWL